MDKQALAYHQHMRRVAKEIAPLDEFCQHCGSGPTEEMLREHPLFPWVATRIGPGGIWHHCYCSWECAAHADEHSAAAYKASLDKPWSPAAMLPGHSWGPEFPVSAEPTAEPAAAPGEGER